MIYFIRSGSKGPIKIGFTSNSVEERMSDLQVGNPFKLYLVGCISGGIDKEAELHQMFKDDRINGEWFRSSFLLNKYIIENCETVPRNSADIKAGVDLDAILRTIETEYITKALDLTIGNKRRAAEMLGISFRSIRYRIDKNGIEDVKYASYNIE